MGLPGMVLSAFIVAAGAILFWVISNQGTGVGLSTTGLTLMIIGAFTFVISAIIFTDSSVPWRNPQASLDSRVIDPQERLSIARETSK
jgi:hypothetical protein